MWLRNVQEVSSTSNKLCEHSAWPDFALTCENKLFHTGNTQVWCTDDIELDLFFMLNVWKRGNRTHSSRGWRAAAVQGWTLFCLNIVLLEKCRFRSVKIWLWTDVNKWFVSNRHFWLKAKVVCLLFPQGECFTKIFTLMFWNRRTKKSNLKTMWHFIWLKWLMRGNGRGE